MTADATTSLFIQYQTPLVLSPVVLKLTLQRQTWDQRPCSRLVDAFLSAARPSILKAAAFSQGRAPRVEDVFHADDLVLTDSAGATVKNDAPVAELTKGAAVARAALLLPRTVNGTGHTGPSEFCATSIRAVLRRSSRAAATRTAPPREQHRRAVDAHANSEKEGTLVAGRDRKEPSAGGRPRLHSQGRLEAPG